MFYFNHQQLFHWFLAVNWEVDENLCTFTSFSNSNELNRKNKSKTLESKL